MNLILLLDIAEVDGRITYLQESLKKLQVDISLDQHVRCHYLNRIKLDVENDVTVHLAIL